MSAAAQRDYYEVLGVAKDAADKQIKDAFRKLAMQYHPDRNKEPGAEERFKEIAAAYAVLSDPAKRREYDERGFAAVGGVSPEDLFRNVDFADLFSGLGFDFGGFAPSGRGGLFERLFGHRHAGPMRGENIEVELEVPLERVATGGEETVKFSRPVVCTACGGSGAKRGTSPRRCEACQGTGRKLLESRRQPSRGEVRIDRWVSCPECGGRGMVTDQSCPECKGLGRVERQESLAVKIPVGVEEGMALRISGHGMPSLEVGGSPGDLLVIVHSAADERFERVGTDLWRRERVTIPEAVLGTTLRVPSLEADVEVTVPRGTQPDSVLRLEGKGLPNFGASGRGDLNLRIEVSVPQRLTAQQRGLYEELRALESRGAATGATTRARGRAKR